MGRPPVKKSKAGKTKEVAKKRSGPEGTNPTTVAAMRQEFLSGLSIRELSNKYHVSVRTIGKYSSLQGWDKERKAATVPSGVEVISAAADARVLAVQRSFGERVEVLAAQCASVAERAGAILDKQTFDSADVKELAGTMRVMISNLVDLKSMVPASMSEAGPIDSGLAALSDAELEAMLR